MKTPEDIYPDLAEWPERWAGLPEYVPHGQAILEVMRPFMQHLIEKGRNVRTIRRHMDNLWLLGGEIIHNIGYGYNEENDPPPAEQLMRSIGSDGGPLCRHCHTESEQESFDTTCRQLHRFLSGG